MPAFNIDITKTSVENLYLLASTIITNNITPENTNITLPEDVNELYRIKKEPGHDDRIYNTQLLITNKKDQSVLARSVLLIYNRIDIDKLAIKKLGSNKKIIDTHAADLSDEDCINKVVEQIGLIRSACSYQVSTIANTKVITITANKDNTNYTYINQALITITPQ